MIGAAQVALRRLLPLAVLLCIGFGHAAHGGTQTLNQAEIRWLADGSRTQTVSLPYFYRADSRAHQGPAEFLMAFDGPSPEHAELPFALSLPMTAGNATVFVNGMVLERFGAEGEILFRHTRVPQVLTIPRAILKHQNELVIRVEGNRAILGVPQMQIGDYGEIMRDHSHDWLLSVGGRFFGGAFALFVAFTCVALWWTQVRVRADGTTQREVVYLFGTVAQIAWTVRVAGPLFEVLPAQTDWLLVVSSVSLGIWTTFLMLQCLDLSRWPANGHARWFRYWLWAQLLLGVLASAIAWVWHLALWLSVWYALNIVSAAAFSLAFVAHSWRHKLPWSTRGIAAALALNVIAGVVDFVRTRVMGDYSAFNWLYPSSAVLGLAMVIMVVQRFRVAQRQADEFSHTLERKVRQREAELVQAQKQMTELLQEQARTAERSRIMKNMHDGVGSHLSLAIHQLAKDSANVAVVLDTLRDGMDHLKLTVDLGSIRAGDVIGLLGSLRYRLEPRLQAAGIHLVWDVADFETPAAWAHRDLSPLLYALYEIISNVLQHAHASELQVHCSRSGERVTLRLQDNGVGLDPQRKGGRGLAIVRARVAELGADVTWHSVPGCTAVTVHLG